MLGLIRNFLRLFVVLFILAGMIVLARPAGAVTQSTDTTTTNLALVVRGRPFGCGDITRDTVWRVVNSPIQLFCDVTVLPGVTLTIEAGVTVQFSGVDTDLIVSGALQAVGTASTPIHFQPFSGAQAGSWGRVAFLPGSSGRLDHTIVAYGGSQEGLVYIASDAVEVLNSTVQYSLYTGIVIRSASPLIDANQIINNVGISGGGLSNDTGSPRVQRNRFSGNSSKYGGGMYNDSGSPIIQNNDFNGNFANSSGGGFNNYSGSPMIRGNTFTHNTAQNGAGGGLYTAAGAATIQNNLIASNSAHADTDPYGGCGGGGGGLYNGAGTPTIQNNTIFGNAAECAGGFATGGSPIVRSNLFVNNSLYSEAGIVMDYNDLWHSGSGGYGIIHGPHDIYVDPLLVDPANDDFHLAPGSPCIDAGDPVNYPAMDLEGDLRSVGSASDIGVDEFTPLQLGMQGDPGEVLPGAEVTYTVNMNNLGVLSLTNLLLVDTLPGEATYISYHAAGLSCTHDGSPSGGTLSCTLKAAALASGESQTLTVLARLVATFPAPQAVANAVEVTANAEAETVAAHAHTRTQATWCAVRLNNTPLGSDLQAAIDASLSATDVIKVSGYCRAHDLDLNKTLTLQGGWSQDFTTRDAAVHTTTLDAESLGRVILVDGEVSPVIDGFVITGGYILDFGGGISIPSGNPTIQNNHFSANSAYNPGGGLYNGSGNPLIQNNAFTGNFNANGSGLVNATGSPRIQGNTFIGNPGGSAGGMINESGNPLVQQNTFAGNLILLCQEYAPSSGGLLNKSGSPTILNNIFSGNSSRSCNDFYVSAGGLLNETGSPLIQGNTIRGNYGRGLILQSGAPIIQANLIVGNQGGGLSIASGTPTIQGNTISSNTGGSGLFIETGSPIVQNNLIANNTGGGLSVYGGHALIQYNLITGNSTDSSLYNSYGGGLFILAGHTVIIGNIVVGNTALVAGGIYIHTGGSYQMDYNDVWNNMGGDYADCLQYNCVIPGPHDISVDPRLVDPANGDFHLASDSSCVNAGDPEHYPAVDFDQDLRPMGSAPDIGMDEYRQAYVHKTGSAEEALPGDPITYTVIIANLEAFPLENVILTDTLPIELTYLGYQADGLTCTPGEAAWGGQLRCTLDSLSLLPGESRILTVRSSLTTTFLIPQTLTNEVELAASVGGEAFTARDRETTSVTWCAVQLNDTSLGSDLQAAIEASAQATDVVKVSGYCRVHDLSLNKTLTLQGGWNRAFSAWDPEVYTTTLDAHSLGRVLQVDGQVNPNIEPTIEGFLITGGSVNGSGGGFSILSGSPTIQNNTFTGNSVFGGDVSGGGLNIETGDAIIQSNTFRGNTSDQFGGGVNIVAGSPTIQDNLFAENIAGFGGGLNAVAGAPLIQNNVFSGNTASSGGGLYGNTSALLLQNNTFFGNTAVGGAGMHIVGSDATIRSNIVANNTASEYGGGISGNAYVLDYNDVWNNTGGDYSNVTPGMHDMSADPRLVDPIHGDFHLAPDSPCIEAGDPINYPASDFEGDLRPGGVLPDIGADEYRSLYVLKASTQPEAELGTPVTYTMVLANMALVDLTEVVLTDTLPAALAFISYQSNDLTCTHDGAAWGGQLRCTLDSLSLPQDEQRVMTVTVILTDTLDQPQEVINPVRVSASGSGAIYTAYNQSSIWVSWCKVQLNDTPMSTIQAALDASTQAADVVKVSGSCPAHDLSLTKTLTLQGGWSVDFSDQDPAVHTTTLDGQSLGRVLLVDGGVNPTIEGFIIMGGETDGNGGGISIISGSPLIQNNTFRDNLARTGGGLYNEAGSPTIQNNTFTGNSASGAGSGFSGGGLANSTGSPLILGNTFTGNFAEDRGGGLYNISGSPTIRDNTFTGNSVDNPGGGDGGGLSSDYGNPAIQNNLFENNEANEGGGLYIAYDSPLIQNNIFTSNMATTAGGGIYNEYGSPTIRNNTIVNNSADYGGGLYNVTYDLPDFRGNIVAGNSAATGGGIYHAGYGSASTDYNDVWNNTGGDYGNVTPGAHDLSVDPRLVNPAIGDFHLAAGSPCIDAADPLNYPPTDFEGEARPNGTAPDIGVDEFYARMD